VYLNATFSFLLNAKAVRLPFSKKKEPAHEHVKKLSPGERSIRRVDIASPSTLRANIRAVSTGSLSRLAPCRPDIVRRGASTGIAGSYWVIEAST
jgi:hypothetical protein